VWPSVLKRQKYNAASCLKGETDHEWPRYGAIIVATAVWIYFSPLQTCIRATVGTGVERNAETYCSQR
jgi:hypothetical protein